MKVVLFGRLVLAERPNEASINELARVSISSSRQNRTSFTVTFWEEGPAIIGFDLNIIPSLMDLSNWKFRKSLESMEAYPDSRPFKLEIEHGNREILVMVTRQMEIILTQPNENPFSKFLSLRFCREMMLLGEQQVIVCIQKLVPAILKICSYRLDSADPNRGSTYFQNHPSFVKANPKEKENLKLLGSSLLIICLESIRVWAGWVAVGHNGQESVFKKGFTSLIERGVTFCAEDKYYKKTDEEKFNNTYKVEFFETSEVIDEASEAESSAIAPNPFLKQQLGKLQAYRRQLETLVLNVQRPSFSSDLEKLKSKISLFHEQSIQKLQKYIQTNSRTKLQQKNNLDLLFKEQNWCETFLSHYTQLSNRKIGVQEFAHNCLADKNGNFEEIKIGVEEAAQKPDSANFKKKGLSTTVDIKEQVAAALKQQKGLFENTIRRMEMDLSKKDREIQDMKLEFDRIFAQTKIQHESRLNNLKAAFAKQSSTNTQSMDKERQLQFLLTQIKQENAQLKKQLSVPAPAPDNREFLKLQEDFRAMRQVNRSQQQVAMECERELSRRQNKIGQLIEQAHNDKITIAHLQQQIKDLRIKHQAALVKYETTAPELEKMAADYEKLLKDNINLQDQVNLYKQQLNEITGKKYNQRDQEVGKLEETSVKLKKEVEELKKQLHMQAEVLNQKEIEIVRLKQESQRIAREARQAFLTQKNPTPVRESFNSPPRESSRQVPSGYKTYVGSGFNSRNSAAQINPPAIKSSTQTKSPWRSSQQSINGMDEFYNSFGRMTRQSYLRFCKACLKNKELLYKENELEIGVISQKLSASKVKLIIHYTNNSETALTDFKAKLYSPRTIRTAIVSDVSSQIDPAEQQKEEVTHQVLEYPIRKVGLELNFNKRGKKETLSLLLPILILKFVDYREPRKQPSPNLLEHRQSQYNTKVIQSGKTIRSYIPQFRESGPNVFDVQVIHKHLDLTFFLRLIIKEPSFTLEAYGEPLSPELTKILEQYLNSLQMVLSK